MKLTRRKIDEMLKGNANIAEIKTKYKEGLLARELVVHTLKSVYGLADDDANMLLDIEVK